MDELEEAYEYSEESMIGWSVGNVCAAKLSTDERWHRARVLSRPDTLTACVSSLDYGYKVILHYMGI